MMRMVFSVAVALVALLAVPAFAETTLSVAKASPTSDAIIPVNVGDELGIFKKHGLDLKILELQGGAKMAQAVAAGSADIGDGAGSELAFVAKGAPMIAVCEDTAPAPFLSIGVPWDSPIKSLDDLKGKKVQITTVGSTTDWLVRKLGEVKGWGPEGVTGVPMGGDIATQIAALRTHQVDAIVGTSSVAFELEERQQGRLLAPTASYVHEFLLHAIFATNSFLQSDPDAVRAFLKGWFQSVAFMRANRAETLKIIVPVTQVDAAAEGREYDLVMPMFSADGKFDDPKALDVMAQSFVDLKILDQKPDLAKFITEKYLPG